MNSYDSVRATALIGGFNRNTLNLVSRPAWEIMWNPVGWEWELKFHSYGNPGDSRVLFIQQMVKKRDIART